MKRPVLWSRDALDDLKQQLVYIATDNPAAARRVVERIRQIAGQLEDLPTGRPGRVTGTYEKSIARLPYIIAYTFAEHHGREVIAILRVIHTSRDWPDEEWPSA